MNQNKGYISTFKFKWCKCPSHSKRTASVSHLPVKPSDYYKELIKNPCGWKGDCDEND